MLVLNIITNNIYYNCFINDFIYLFTKISIYFDFILYMHFRCIVSYPVGLGNLLLVKLNTQHMYSH